MIDEQFPDLGRENPETVKCSHCLFEFNDAELPEVKMGYVICPSCGWWVDQSGQAFAAQETHDRKIEA